MANPCTPCAPDAPEAGILGAVGAPGAGNGCMAVGTPNAAGAAEGPEPAGGCDGTEAAGGAEVVGAAGARFAGQPSERTAPDPGTIAAGASFKQAAGKPPACASVRCMPPGAAVAASPHSCSESVIPDLYRLWRYSRSRCTTSLLMTTQPTGSAPDATTPAAPACPDAPATPAANAAPAAAAPAAPVAAAPAPAAPTVRNETA